MPPAARGRGRARGAAPMVYRRGRSASVASGGMPGGAPGTQLCGTCCKDVGDDAIGCDECEVWVHSTEMCSGLSLSMIQAIERYDGAGIKFVCTKCRLDFSVKRGGSPTSSTEMHLVELVKHLSQQLMGICSVVQQLKNEINLMRGQPESAQTNLTIPHPPDHAHVPSSQTASASGTLPVPGPPSSEYRKVVREELRELQEQQKRRSSLIIRGLGADSAGAAVRAFEEVSEFLLNQRVTLTDVVQIPSESDLFRGKVADDSTRRLILDRAKQLKDTTRFGSVFIRRDLTYKQRQEIKVRREAATQTSSLNRFTRPRPTHQDERAPILHRGDPEQHPDSGDRSQNLSNVQGAGETIPKQLQTPAGLQSNE